MSKKGVIWKMLARQSGVGKQANKNKKNKNKTTQSHAKNISKKV